jgi:hypothetical protein
MRSPAASTVLSAAKSARFRVRDGTDLSFGERFAQNKHSFRQTSLPDWSAVTSLWLPSLTVMPNRFITA